MQDRALYARLLGIGDERKKQTLSVFHEEIS